MFTDDVLAMLQRRTSCRNFDPSKSLSPEQRDALFRYASVGPSAGDLRACSFHETFHPQEKLQLQKLALDQVQVGEASSVFCICAIPELSAVKYGHRGNLYSIQDASIMGMNITYAATALGLDSCWVGSIDVDRVIKMLNLPPGEIPLTFICIGYRKVE